MATVTVSNITNALKDMADHADLAVAGYKGSLKGQIVERLDTALRSADPVARWAAEDDLRTRLLPQLDTLLDGLAQAGQVARMLADQVPDGSAAAATGSIGTTAAGTAAVGVPGMTADADQAGPATAEERDMVEAAIAKQQDQPQESDDKENQGA